MDHLLHTQADPWTFALEELSAGRRAVLVFVVEHSGSVPGVTGTRVVVGETEFAGTIGGGAAEQELIERARRHQEGAEIVRFRHTPGEGGTLCSGLQVFAVMLLSQNEVAHLQSIVEVLQKHQTGMLCLGPQGLRFEAGANGPREFASGDEDWSFTEPLGLLHTLTIIGGGHVSLAFSRVMATLPFRIVVLDNRPELPTMAANTFAHDRRVVDFDRIADHVVDGDRSWVTIMTFGHAHDRRVLEGLLGRRYAYLGLMGSKAKVARMFADMRRDGVPETHLENVRAPIGLGIGSHTPEEIAISIAAEIIALRNGVETQWPQRASR